jgi:hypothetical protein
LYTPGVGIMGNNKEIEYNRIIIFVMEINETGINSGKVYKKIMNKI